ncbi:MAG: hypothetical protein R3A10_09195 [Caldilineaceae bacterium]
MTLLSALLDAPAVSGHEEGVAQIVRDTLTAWGYARDRRRGQRAGALRR